MESLPKAVEDCSSLTELHAWDNGMKDISKVDKESIQKLGAKGIVEIDNQLKIIFGSDARTLKKYINELK